MPWADTVDTGTRRVTLEPRPSPPRPTVVAVSLDGPAVALVAATAPVAESADETADAAPSAAPPSGAADATPYPAASAAPMPAAAAPARNHTTTGNGLGSARCRPRWRVEPPRCACLPTANVNPVPTRRPRTPARRIRPIDWDDNNRPSAGARGLRANTGKHPAKQVSQIRGSVAERRTPMPCSNAYSICGAFCWDAPKAACAPQYRPSTRLDEFVRI